MAYPPPFRESRLQQFARERIYPLGTGSTQLLLFVASFLLVCTGAWVMIYGATVMWALAVLGALMLAAGVLGLLAPVYAIRAEGRKSHHDHLVRMAEIDERIRQTVRAAYARAGMHYSTIDNTGHQVIQGEVVKG